MSTYKFFAIGILLLLGVALFVGMRPQKCGNGGCVNERPAELPYGAPGAFAVGMRQWPADEDWPLDVTLWYPAIGDGNTHEAASYPYRVKIGAPLGNVTIASSSGQAVADAAFEMTHAPYPLVVLSPGFAVEAQAYGWLAEHLASHGFVVIAPEHNETLDPKNELWRAAVSRPQDVLDLFAAIDKQVASGGALAGLVDGEQTAVVGHSYGGYTALAAAGAQIDTASFETHCAEARKAEEPAVWLCDMILPKLADMADMAGFDDVPKGLWPAEVDGRINAVVAMAGDAYFFGQPGLVNIEAPLLAIGGTLDDDTPFDWGPQPAYEHASSERKALLALNDAEHMIFTNPCEPVRWYAKPLAGEFCADSVWERHAAHDVVRHFVTAFLLAELKGETAVRLHLNPNSVTLPNVTFSAQGYGETTP